MNNSAALMWRSSYVGEAPCGRVSGVRMLHTFARGVTKRTSWWTGHTSQIRARCAIAELRIVQRLHATRTYAKRRTTPKYVPQQKTTEEIEPIEDAAASETENTTEQPLTWRDYDPEGGLPLANGELRATEIKEVFGQEMDAETGNWILRLVNYRRQSGSLIDYGIDFEPEMGISKDHAFSALTYLRQIQPDFDENQAGAQWADAQVELLQEDYSERAERVGIYKKADANSSVLVQMREQAEARYEAELLKEQELKERLEAEELAKAQAEGKEEEYVQQKAERDAQAEAQAGQDMVVQEPVQKAWLQPIERKPWVKYYEEQATIVKENVVPQMSIARRLGPSALVVLAVLGACYYLHENYTPPSRSARLFPDMPPAIATIGSLVGITFAVFIGYRMPPLWRFFNKYFLSAPGYPVASSMVLAMFTHRNFFHMLINCTLLWAFGRYLHEDVGRGTFLAIYLASGASAGFFSLAINVLRKRWLTYAFGSSTAVYGVIASTCLLHANNDIKLLGYDVPMTGLIVLGIFVAMELAASRIPMAAATTDVTGHFGGLIFGSLAALAIRKEAGQSVMTRTDFVDRKERTTEDGGSP